MDGIEHAPGNYHRSVLPFSPSGYQFSKHRLLLSRLIPGNANNFPNKTLSTVELCSLHFMLSSSIETQVRGDEATRCGQLSQFRSARVVSPFDNTRKKRNTNRVPRSNYLCDIEMMSDINDRKHCHQYRKHPHARNNPHRLRTTSTTTTQTPIDYEGMGGDGDFDDNDYYGEDEDKEESYDGTSGRRLYDIASNAISQCPDENGVIKTTWGAVSAGPLIAGIAAGLVQQNVATRDLLKFARPALRQNPNQRDQDPPTRMSVDNRWAATLAGDLAEVALLQGPISREMSTGAAGAWNSTTVPHWYFLSQRERLEMTDAEIRGDIDGLALGLKIDEWRRQISQLRLSQLLDMYYSQRGVFSSKFRSCNRRDLLNEFAQPNLLQAQTLAFSTVLDREMQLRVTLTNRNIEQFSTAAADALSSYVSNGLNDVTCDATSALSQIQELQLQLQQYNEVQPALAVLLENLDVNRFGSRITLYNANDASVIVNTTSSLSNFYMLWNQTSHQTQSNGLNLAAIVKQLRIVGKQIIDEENRNSVPGGRSFIALVVPQLTGVNEGDSNYIAEQLVYVREALPDMRLLFWSGGSPGRFARFVLDQQRDLFQLMSFSSGSESSQQIIAYTLPVIQRIQSIPRKIVNPRCNIEWNQNEWGSNGLDQYIEPSGTIFYRVQPNYFYRSGGKVRVQSRYQSQLIVCSSRYVEQPRFSNSTQVDGVNCRQVLSTESYEHDLSNACEGQYLIQTCPPLYISVQSAPTAVQNAFQCTDFGCRFPDETKFTINVEYLGCYSSTTHIIAQSAIVVFSVVLIFVQKFNLFY